MFGFKAKKMEMVSAAEALPGRATAIPTAKTHFVTGRPLTSDVPEGMGVAMSEGARHLARQSDCWKRTLDVSGDGKSNLGPRPRDVKQSLEGRGITINALVIGVDDPALGDTRQADIGELSSYFNAEVILGPDAFVITALGFSDYARAMRDKLERELDGLVLSQLQ